MVNCQNCNAQFETELLPNPCPRCGNIRVAVSGTLFASGSLVAEGKTGSDVDAIRIASQTRSSSADLQPDKTWSHSIQGPPPRNEDGTLEACQRLVAHLNLKPGTWSEPQIKNEDGVDCITMHHDQEIFIQVVRPISPKTYRSLARSNLFEDRKEIKALAEDLLIAVRHKSEKNYPRGKNHTILIVDLADFPAHALPEVASEF